MNSRNITGLRWRGRGSGQFAGWGAQGQGWMECSVMWTDRRSTQLPSRAFLWRSSHHWAGVLQADDESVVVVGV